MSDLPAALAQHVPELALAAALAWGAGIRLYLVVFIFGLASWLGYWQLPEHLAVLAHPLVLLASGFMTLVELLADKLPFLDTAWDAVHTFIRIPAGAALAASVFGESGAAVAMAAALLGGTLTATTHFSKAGTRATVNASPEPFSNAALSFAEDLLVAAGSWLAVNLPLLFLGILGVFLVAALLMLRWVIRGARRLLSRPEGAGPDADARGP
ncbi:MAG: DUF4126 domain-containing protein [Burkholderiaceae bacterium]|nr:DUF4126 domain-containing protein [Burkholderiaceae bacterium]